MFITLILNYYSRIQNIIAPDRSIPSTRAPSQIIRQHLFLPQPIAGDSSSTDPIGSGDDTGITDLYNAPVLKQLIIPTRKNNHINGNDKREYIDIPLPRSILQLNLQHDYIVTTKNNIINHCQKNNNYQSNSNECSCKTSSTEVDKLDLSSNNR